MKQEMKTKKSTKHWSSMLTDDECMTWLLIDQFNTQHHSVTSSNFCVFCSSGVLICCWRVKKPLWRHHINQDTHSSPLCFYCVLTTTITTQISWMLYCVCIHGFDYTQHTQSIFVMCMYSNHTRKRCIFVFSIRLRFPIIIFHHIHLLLHKFNVIQHKQQHTHTHIYYYSFQIKYTYTLM